MSELAEVLPFPLPHQRNNAPAHEPLLTKKQLAAHYSFSTRWVEQRVNEGMPSRLISGKRRFKLSETDAWLEQR